MELKPGYKQTEVGVIPEDWDVRPLLSAVHIANGQVNPKLDPYKSMILVAPDHIERASGRLLDKQTAAEQRAISGKYVFGEGDIVYSKIRPYLQKVILAEFSGLCSADMYPLRPVNDVSGGFMLAVILGHRFSKYAESVSVRSGMPKINRAELAEYALALPPLPEQRAIAAALSDVDALISGLDRLIAKKRDIKQAAMQQLLTGKQRLPGFSGEWEVKRLGDAGSCLRGVTYKGDSDLSPHDSAFTKRLLRSNNVQASSIVISDIQFVNAARVSDNQLLRGNDILVCMANGSKALVGKAGLFMVNDGYEYSFGAFMGCYRTLSETFNPMFIFYLFQTGRYRNYINNLLAGSSINNLNPSSIESLEFSFPLLHEQTAIATILSDMDAEITMLETRRDKSRAIKQGMMQELLTGRIRLV
jgi:type I restriction enzyme, S subunit